MTRAAVATLVAVLAAALAFARASNPDDEIFVMNFADKTRLDVPFTSDPAVLKAGIGRADAIGLLHDSDSAAAKHARRVAVAGLDRVTVRTRAGYRATRTEPT